jgi:hypothetical protein
MIHSRLSSISLACYGSGLPPPIDLGRDCLLCDAIWTSRGGVAPAVHERSALVSDGFLERGQQLELVRPVHTMQATTGAHTLY